MRRRSLVYVVVAFLVFAFALVVANRSARSEPLGREEVRRARYGGYRISTTGAPSTSILGLTPSPGSRDADMRPPARRGAPSAVDTVT